MSQEAQSVHVVPSLSTMVVGPASARAALGSMDEERRRRMSGRRTESERWGAIAMWERAEVGDGDGSGSVGE